MVVVGIQDDDSFRKSTMEKTILKAGLISGILPVYW
ncbi:MAG: hypothetical protein ACJASM_002979 [Salibacteraceae bacterium]|jgi:hypothetical protein